MQCPGARRTIPMTSPRRSTLTNVDSGGSVDEKVDEKVGHEVFHLLTMDSHSAI